MDAIISRIIDIVWLKPKSIFISLCIMILYSFNYWPIDTVTSKIHLIVYIITMIVMRRQATIGTR